jgi:hypothetical protein
MCVSYRPLMSTRRRRCEFNEPHVHYVGCRKVGIRVIWCSVLFKFFLRISQGYNWLDSGTRHTRVGRQFLRLRDLLRIFGETGGKRKRARDRARTGVYKTWYVYRWLIPPYTHTRTHTQHTCAHTSKVVKSDTSAGHHSVHPLEKSYTVLTRYCPKTHVCIQ